MKKITFPEHGNDPRIDEAIQYIKNNDVADVISPADLTLSQADSLDVLRSCPKYKDTSEEELVHLLEDPLTVALLALKDDRVDTVIAGATTTTATVLRSVIRIIGMAEGAQSISSSFILQKEGAPSLIFADCAVQIDPSAENLCDIALSSLPTAERIGLSPRVAFLSFVTGEGTDHPSVHRVSKAAELFRCARPDIAAQGPLQFDAAINTAIYEQKISTGLFAGEPATIFIFPSLESGNIAYKVAQEIGGYKATGPILQGTTKQVHDLSRGCSVRDIIDVARYSIS